MLRIYDTTLRMVENMRPVLARIESKDRDLGRQMRRAVASIVLNLGEGMGSSGGTRRERYRNALGYAEVPENDLELVINTLRKLTQ